MLRAEAGFVKGTPMDFPGSGLHCYGTLGSRRRNSGGGWYRPEWRPNLRTHLQDLLQFIRSGEGTLSKLERQPVDSILSAKDRQRSCHKFYAITKEQIGESTELLDQLEKGDKNESIIEMASNLQHQLTLFSDRLEDTRLRIDDITKCYEILEEVNSWCEEASKLSSSSKVEQPCAGTAGVLLERLNRFLQSRDRVKEILLPELMKLSRKMDNSKLQEQCGAAQSRYGEISLVLEQRRQNLEKAVQESRKQDIQNQSEKQDSKSYDIEAPDLVDPAPSEAVLGVRGSPAYSSGTSVSSMASICSWKTSGSSSRANSEEKDKFDEDLDGLIPVDIERPCFSPVVVRRRSNLLTSPNGHLMNCGQDAKCQNTLQLILQEMIQTERDYVASLEYIIQNYLPELSRPDIPQALRGKRNVLFGNLEKIYEFHSLYFLRELEHCAGLPFLVGHCFLKYENSFYLYALYNKNKPKSDALMAEYGNLFFRRKQYELGDKMDLASYLLKPVQRMGKYALLLKQLIKESGAKDQQLTSLQDAEQMVCFQLRHGNDLLAMDSLRDCDVNVKEQGRLLRQSEFIVWRQRRKKTTRHIFLFEDLILFSKTKKDPEKKVLDIYVYKQSMKTADIGFTAQVGDSNTKFEIWFRKRKPNETFILEAASPDIKNFWVEELSRMLWKQALRNRDLRMAEMVEMGVGNKPCLEIRPSQDRISDRSISYYQLPKMTRFRHSVCGSVLPEAWGMKRPHSIISISSSGGSTTSSGSDRFAAGTQMLPFMKQVESPLSENFNQTNYSQCSAESGIYADLSFTYEESNPGNYLSLPSCASPQ